MREPCGSRCRWSGRNPFAERQHEEIFRCEEKSCSKNRNAPPRQSGTAVRRGRGATKRAKRGGRKWSHKVTERSDALDLRKGVFKLNDPKTIAASLKRSAERCKRRKADPYRSAQSMLTFYINRAGKDLPASRKRTLERAKGELRRQFGRA
jgi:hypothetical protein